MTNGLFEQHCERFQPIFLLLLICHEYYLVGHSSQHCAHSRSFFFNLSKLSVARSADHKSAISSLPSYHTLFEVFVMYLQICIAKHELLYFTLFCSCWCHNIIVNVHTPTENTIDFVKYSFYEELERVFKKI
jgi:hypothetical protein